jgi:cholinesterase
VNGEGGAYHGAEIAMIFGTLPDGATEREGRYIRGARAAFAKDPEEGLACYGGCWAVYETGKETLVRLAFNDTVGPNLGDPEVSDSVCQ